MGDFVDNYNLFVCSATPLVEGWDTDETDVADYNGFFCGLTATFLMLTDLSRLRRVIE